MKAVILDYGAGNIGSVKNALNRLGYKASLTACKDEIQAADKVIFPGVGHAKHAMHQLKKKDLSNLIKELRQPVLGICLGMQLLCSHTEEENTKSLGVFSDKVVGFVGEEKIPHMGWNSAEFNKNSPFEELNGSYFYFVHSYYVPISINTLSKTKYIQEFSSSLQKDNFFGCQFHPEKSSDKGLAFLDIFMKI